jgi:signal transduction histidine kinase/DNA-binding response OmpR family regulator
MSGAVGMDGWLRRFSIRMRLVLLAVVLLLAMSVSSLFVRWALHSARVTAETASHIGAIVDIASGVRSAFNDLRYWQTDLAVSLLALAETRAEEARTRLGEQLALLEQSEPDAAHTIREEAAHFDDLAGQAIDAYTDNNRVIGNTLFAQARQHGVVVDQRLTEVLSGLREKARAARANTFRQFSRAANVSLGLTLAAILAGAILTVVILRSILKPLGGIVGAVRGLTQGDTGVAIPAGAGDELGRVGEALFLLRDSMAERDRLTREAERQRRTLSDAIESIAEGFALYGPDDRLLVTNQRFRAMHPNHVDQAARQANFAEVIETAGRHVIRTEASPEQWIAERLNSHSHNSSRVAQFRDGRWMQISERQTHEGGFTVVYTDISELRHREAALEAARDEAQRATQVKSEFLANMSHELRTPLNAIIGYAQILQEDVADAGQTDFLPDLKKIETAGNHLLGLINDILDLSKIEAGRMEVYNETFDVAGLVGEVEMLVRPLAARNDNTLVIKCADDIGAIESDVTKVKQTLLNLLSNASKFTKQGTIELAVERSILDGAPMLAFAVSDTGIGMTEEQLSRLFQAFSQADNSTTRKFGGTGLGLAISRSFAKMLGGDLTATSKPGEGSRFLFTLPAANAAPGPSAEGSPPTGIAEGAPRPIVLVVDDDASALHIIGAHLTRDGYRVVYASSGAEALEQARTHRPAAITLDIMMPQMDGWSVLVELKKDPELAGIPVVIVSISNEKALGFSLGAAGMLTKPVDREELSDFVGRLTKSHASGTVLVVEDDSATRQLMERAIEKLGYGVALTGNGKEGIDWLSANPAPIAILLDLQMPEMNGFDFLTRLRSDERWKFVPVLVVTAQQLSLSERQLLMERTEQIIAKGAGGYLELTQALRNVLASHEPKDQRN